MNPRQEALAADATLLDPARAMATPSARVNDTLNEATPTLVFGVPQAAVSTRWPANVPSRERARTLMFDPSGMPEVLRAPTLDLLRAFAANGLATVPEGLEESDWLLALATTWRLTVAAALADGKADHDEAALQAMVEEAASVRGWLTTLVAVPYFEGEQVARELRALLQAAWGELLEAAPAAPALETVETRITARPRKTSSSSGLTAVNTAPKPSAGSKPRLPVVILPTRADRRRTILLATLLGLLVFVFLSTEPQRKAERARPLPPTTLMVDAP